jgi:glutamyl-tRNA reductase
MRVQDAPRFKIYNPHMTVWALGINHHTAALDLRGRFAFTLDQLPQSLHQLQQALRVAPNENPVAAASPNSRLQPEATIVSTCNRTEIYGSGDAAQLAQGLAWLAQTGGVSVQDLSAHTYALYDAAAARHAFRVASGLDSMVLGEPQILGQLKDAVRVADEQGALGGLLGPLFQRSFAVAKAVRSTTGIGEHSISMAAAAVRLAGQLFEDLGAVRVLFVGAGEMIELAATHFQAKNPLQMVIANRSRERGEALAQRLLDNTSASANISTLRLAELPERLHEFDVVVSCTASSLPLIGLGAVERALKKRKHKPMFMVDLAVPRDIEPEVKQLSDVFLYTVDDLAAVVQSGQAQRQAAVVEAEKIVVAGVEQFMHWLHSREHVPIIQALHARANDWREQALAKARRQLSKGDAVDEVLQSLAKSLSQKMLHGALAELASADPTVRARALVAIDAFYLR